MEPTIRAATVRTELSPYNRDYVEALPPTILNVRTTHREPMPIKRNLAAQAQTARAVVSAKGAQVVQQPKNIIRQPLPRTALSPRFSLRNWMIGGMTALAVLLIAGGGYLVSQSSTQSAKMEDIKTSSLSLTSQFLENAGGLMNGWSSSLKAHGDSPSRVASHTMVPEVRVQKVKPVARRPILASTSRSKTMLAAKSLPNKGSKSRVRSR